MFGERHHLELSAEQVHELLQGDLWELSQAAAVGVIRWLLEDRRQLDTAYCQLLGDLDAVRADAVSLTIERNDAQRALVKALTVQRDLRELRAAVKGESDARHVLRLELDGVRQRLQLALEAIGELAQHAGLVDPSDPPTLQELADRFGAAQE
jgi:hypothetical protein